MRPFEAATEAVNALLENGGSVEVHYFVLRKGADIDNTDNNGQRQMDTLDTAVDCCCGCSFG